MNAFTSLPPSACAASADAVFRAVFERAAVGLARVSFDDGRWLEVNDALCRLLGYAREELLGMAWPAVTHADDIQADLQQFRRMAAGEIDSYTLDKRVIHKAGHVVWARLTLSLVRNAAGQPDYEVAVIEDISDRRAAEAAQAESARRFRAVLETVQAVGVKLDATGRITFVNPYLLQLTGWRADELLGADWFERLVPEGAGPAGRTLREYFQQSVARGEIFAHFENEILTRSGERRLIAWDNTILRDNDGAVVGTASIGRDITEARAQAQALAASEERYALAARAAHNAIWDWDLATNALRWSEGVREIFGHAGSAVGTTVGWWYESIHPEDRQRVVASIHAVIERQPSDVDPATEWREEYRFLRGDGSYASVIDRGHVARDATGRAYRMIGAMTDVTREREAVARLRDREAHLAAVFEQTGAAFAECDLAGRYIAVNQRFCDLLFRSRDELLGLTIAQTTFEDDLALCEGQVSLLVDSGVPFSVEKRFVRPDGSPVWVAVTANRLALPGGGQSLLIVAIDIAARKSAEARLLASETRFKTAVQASSHILWTNDAEGRMLGEQPGWAGFTGQTRQEYQGYGWVEALHPDDAAPSVAAWEQAVAAGTRYVFEQRVRRRDGMYRTFSVGALPVRDAQGALVEWVGVHTDITDLREANRALHDSEAHYRSLFDNLTEEVHFWSLVRDAQGRIETWRLVDANPPALATWGRQLDDIRGCTTDEIFGPGSTEHYRGIVEKVMAGGQALSYEDYFAQMRKHFRFTTIPLADGFITTGADITHIKEAQALIERQNVTLREADRRKDEFLATLAHELRNPLAPLRTALHIIERSDDPVLLTQARRIMNRQLGQMVRLIDDLLDVSRITTGKLHLNRERVPLQRVLQQAIETARPRIEARHHRLIVEPALREVWLNGDSLRLAQVFTNLLNNAAKYSENGATITVHVQPFVHGGERVRVSVSDTGIGIPPESLSRVFDLFTQIDHGADKAQGGLGIGLSLVQRLLQLHGGTIEAASAGIGKGSTFTVELPVEPAQGHAGTGGNGAPELAGAPCTLVVADDNRDAADSLAIMLRLGGHTVHLAYDGAGAVQAVLQHRPQVAIIDIGMPNGDGHEVARSLHQQLGEQCPVLLALSGWGQEVDKRASREAGFDHHFTKPVDVTEIERLLASMYAEAA